MGANLTKTTADGMSAAKALLALVVIVFGLDLLVAYVLVWFGQASLDLRTILMAAVLLAAIAAPAIYWLVALPFAGGSRRRAPGDGLPEDLGPGAVIDPLTRIMNRRGITVGLLEAMAQAERYDTPLTVGMVDIDHFKQVNDAHGREEGDKVLAEIAGLLTEALRMPDKVGRYGGEEFVIVLPHTALPQGRKIAERVRTAVKDYRFRIAGKKEGLTLSIGITQYRKGEDLEQLMSHANQALADARRGGRNLVAAFKPS